MVRRYTINKQLKTSYHEKLLLILTMFFATSQIFVQTTAIIDANFEQALINLGNDTGTPYCTYYKY